MPPTPLVHIVDDDPGMRKSLGLVMTAAAIPSAGYASAADFLGQRVADAATPAEEAGGPGQGVFDPAGCLLLDLRMPGMTGQELLETLRLRGCRIPVIIITGHADVPAAVQTLKAGAVDFLTKPVDHHVLVDLVRKALAGDAERRARDAERRGILEKIASLSPRQRAMLDLIVAGKSNKEIASEWGISFKTVTHHRAHLMTKLGAGNAADLVRMAMIAGAKG